MISYVYVIFNSRNGKVYVGWTSNPKERWRKHRKNAIVVDVFLYRAMRKEMNAFEFSVISSHPSEAEAMMSERYWISFFKSNDDRFGYNMTEGGEGCVIYGPRGPRSSKYTYRPTEEHIKKLTEGRLRKMNFDSTLRSRLDQLRDIKKKYGYVAELSRLWNVSHTQVMRFIKKYGIVV